MSNIVSAGSRVFFERGFLAVPELADKLGTTGKKEGDKDRETIQETEKTQKEKREGRAI